MRFSEIVAAHSHSGDNLSEFRDDDRVAVEQPVSFFGNRFFNLKRSPNVNRVVKQLARENISKTNDLNAHNLLHNFTNDTFIGDFSVKPVKVLSHYNDRHRSKVFLDIN